MKQRPAANLCGNFSTGRNERNEPWETQNWSFQSLF